MDQDLHDVVITVVKPTWEMLTPKEWFPGMKKLTEKAGRVCYKSEHKIHKDSAVPFIEKMIRSGHESVIEHCAVSVKIIGSRAMSHQLVRHRIAAFSQESQRYCDYGNKGLQVVCPPSVGIPPDTYRWNKQAQDWVNSNGVPCMEVGGQQRPWITSIQRAYYFYKTLRNAEIRPEDARFVLPNATKTEVVTTFNLRQWRHVFQERALNPHAQWEIRGILRDALDIFAILLPEFFADLLPEDSQDTPAN